MEDYTEQENKSEEVSKETKAGSILRSTDFLSKEGLRDKTLKLSLDSSFDSWDHIDLSEESDNEEEFQEMFSVKEITTPVKKIKEEDSEIVDLDFKVDWNLSEIRDKMRNFLEEGEIRDILNYYQKLRNFDDGRSVDFKEITAAKLIEKHIEKIYGKFIETKLEQNVSIDFMGFLPNRYLNDRSMINHYFDKIYILNLDRRPDRMLNMERRLKRWNIYNWKRFPAIDGTQSPHWEEWKHYTKARLTREEKIKYHRKAIASSGSWAILKSMYHLLKDAKKNNYGRILVLQDDVLFHKRFQEEFSKVPSMIPDKKWRLLYLGGTQHNWNHIIKSNSFYYPNGTTDGAFAVGIHSEIYDELIAEILKFEMPVDSGALRDLQKKYTYQSYVLFPNLIIADIRDSDLRHSRDLTNFGKRFKWDIKLYEIDD